MTRHHRRGASKPFHVRAKSAAALFVALAAATQAQAFVIGATPAASFGDAALTIAFGAPGEASYTFSVNTMNTGVDPVAISTGGSGLVASLGAPFYDPPRPTAYFSGALIDANLLAQFLPYPTPAAVPYSIADDFIGLRFTLADGVHYGYAEVAGPTLLSYGYESVAGVGILTGAPPVAAVPEPTTLVLFGVGLAAVGWLRKRPASTSRDATAV